MLPALLCRGSLEGLPPGGRDAAPAAARVSAGHGSWPSQTRIGRPNRACRVAQQKAELTALLNHAVQFNLNAVIFQVRPSWMRFCLPMEPWSEYLTGTMGRAPAPFYDPLAFAIAEAHRRGLECTRGSILPGDASAGGSLVALNHISRTHPELIRQSATRLSGSRRPGGAGAYVLRVVMDVVQRYDVEACSSTIIFIPTRKRTGGTRAGFSRRCELAEIRPAQRLFHRDDWRRPTSINSSTGLSIHQGRETAGEIRHQSVRHLAPGDPSQINGLDTYAKFTRIRACGSRAAGLIISRRNFIGRWIRRNKVFPFC